MSRRPIRLSSFLAWVLLLALIALLSVSVALAESMDEQIREAREHLERNAMKLRPDEKAERLQALANCVRGPFNPAINPDRMSFGSKLAAPTTKAASVYGILNYRGGRTDADANEGIKNWMRASVTSDCRFYRAARIFLKELQKKDFENDAQRDTGREAPIQNKARFDVLTIARSSVRAAFDGTREDPYLAQKVLSLYGHDNTHNELAASPPNRCEYAVLDAYKPIPSSNLYRNGAMGGIEFPASDVEAGKKVAQACINACGELKDPNERLNCTIQCNDDFKNYQADYYHVIASSYLICFAEANHRRSGGVLSAVASGLISAAGLAADVVFDREYSELAKVYNKERFTQQLKYAGKKDTQAPIYARIAHDALELYPKPVSAGALCAKMQLRCTETDIRIGQAIIDRQVFEIGFRARQHKLGQDFAKKECRAGNAEIDHPVCAQ